MTRETKGLEEHALLKDGEGHTGLTNSSLALVMLDIRVQGRRLDVSVCSSQPRPTMRPT